MSGMRRAEEISIGGVEPLGVLDVGRCGEHSPPARHTTSAPLISPPYYPPPAYYPPTDQPNGQEQPDGHADLLLDAYCKPRTLFVLIALISVAAK